MVELRTAKATDTPVCEGTICRLGVSEWLYEMVAVRSQSRSTCRGLGPLGSTRIWKTGNIRVAYGRTGYFCSLNIDNLYGGRAFSLFRGGSAASDMSDALAIACLTPAAT